MDQRLSLIKEMMCPCHCAADIGTDHGYLICAVVEAGIAEQGIAADINPLPLATAEQQIAARGLQSRITTRLTDGLQGIACGEGDAVVIAGMGGDLIARILEDWERLRTPGIDYYLQPMTKAERLREYLYATGFRVVSERCCIAAHRPYSVMQVRYTGGSVDHTPADLYLGGIDPAAGAAEAAYCEKLMNRLTRRLHGLRVSGGQEAAHCQQIIDCVKGRINHAGRGYL